MVKTIIILIDIEKDNINGNMFKLIKIIYEKLTANVMLNGEILILYY